MGDQRGLGLLGVKECTSLGIEDLGNVYGYEQPGQSVYGFLLTRDGYARIPVQAAEPEWIVDLALKQSQVHMRKTVLTHLFNAGKMFVSYAPAPPQRNLAVVEGFNTLYILRPKAGSGTNVPVKATTTFTKDHDMLEKPPAGSTIILKIILGEPPATKEWKEVLPNLSFQKDKPLTCADVCVDRPGQ